MYSVILTEMGIILREDGKYVRSFPFSDKVQEYLDTKAGEGNKAALAVFLATSEAETNDAGLLSILEKNGIDARMMSGPDIDAIQDTKPAILVEGGFASNEHDSRGKLREFALELSSSRVAQISETPDLHIIQAINSLDETDRIANSLFGRLREWYGLHFPELENLVDGISGYCKIALVGRRTDLGMEIFTDAGFPESKADMLNLVSKTSRGGDISDENLKHVQVMARQVLDIYQTRRSLEEHVEEQMRQAAPNLSAIVGAGVGARLMARAGSLQRLATMAASTIQVLGAEKALFRAIKTGSQPPKHGLIFQHAMVHKAPRWQRGKIARAVASKAAIAARMDLHEPVLNNTLLEKLNVRVEEIGEKYSEPPQKPPSYKHDPKNYRDKRGGRVDKGGKRKGKKSKMRRKTKSSGNTSNKKGKKKIARR